MSSESNVSMRPPAVPLIACDPYWSIWSMSDRLTDDQTRHWTGRVQSVMGMARIDGAAYRFMSKWYDLPAMEQMSVQVLPTQTIYKFRAGGIDLSVTFLTPLLPQDLDIMSRPVTYVLWSATATDGRTHDVSVYLDASASLVIDAPSWAVNSPEWQVNCWRNNLGKLRVLAAASQKQDVLGKSGDDLRLDWGTLYLVNPAGGGSDFVGFDQDARNSFIQRGTLPDRDDMDFPRPAMERWPVLACALDLGKVGSSAVSAHVLLAYDDRYSIEYFHRKLRPYWRRSGMGAAELIETADRELPALLARCRKFDDELVSDLRATGGEPFAQLASLAFRQCIAAHKLVVDLNGTPLLFSKENFSNGCIATVDVTYPSSPFFLLLNPELLKAQLTPILDYASLPRWRWPFAPHDLGQYPLANGQVYGGGERTEEDQMPVEECGNMLLMVAALARAQGHAQFAQKYWTLLSRWAGYLRDKGMDPENQLCTDDFAGHLAHNTNLSIKAILAIGAYAQLAQTLGHSDVAKDNRQAAADMAAQWARMADDGDHYRLAFDQPGTWSQKYNLVWDRLLELNLFPAEVARKEIAFYKTQQRTFGLPLDNRKEYTKLDWIVWTATMADSRSDFDAFIEPLYRWLSQTPSRVPLSDWFWTTDGRHIHFQARSVVGGVFIPLLRNEAMWKKWLGLCRR